MITPSGNVNDFPSGDEDFEDRFIQWLEKHSYPSILQEKNPDIVKIVYNHYRWVYYNSEPELTDEEFDILEEYVSKLIPSLPNEIGSTSWDGFPKAKHLMFMNSQNKVKSADEFKSWIDKHPSEMYLIQPKVDGISIELIYKRHGINFRLTEAITRGVDGNTGDNIIDNVRKMGNVKEELIGKSIPTDIFSIRGEIYLPRNIFLQKYKPMGHRNPRNSSTGLAKQKYGKGSEDLSIIFYDLYYPGLELTEFNKLLLLKEIIGLSSMVPISMKYNFTDIQEKFVEYCDTRSKYPYDMDGIVIKMLQPDKISRNRPENQIAWKYPPEEGITTLASVSWNINGSTYTPVGILVPLNLNGTNVSKASLVNLRCIRELDVAVGDKVLVTKRGEIIPKIESVKTRTEYRVPITPPTNCIGCDSELIITPTRIWCGFNGCSFKLGYQIRTWINVLNIKDFGPTFINALCLSGKVSKLSDIYRLAPDDHQEIKFESREIGAKTFTKALNNLHEKKSLPLDVFMGGVGIHSVSVKIFGSIIKTGYNTVEKILNITEAELICIPGIKELKADRIIKGLAHRRNDILELAKFVKIEELVIIGRLKGVSVCFTGGLESMTRNEATRKVIDLAGGVRSSVSGGLTYLVCSDPTTSKSVKAVSLGVKVISEQQFLELIA